MNPSSCRRAGAALLLVFVPLAAALGQAESADATQPYESTIAVDPAVTGAKPSATRATEAEPVTTLETIVVTGEKMNRSLAETTTSATVFDERNIEAQGDRSLSELLRRAANTASGEEGSFSIRGVAREGASGDGSPLISVQLDGVTLDRLSQQSADDLFDVAQVEVLRGAQSTSQGRNALAGAVVLNTRDPTADWDSRVRLQVGEHNQRSVAFAGGGPINDEFGFRVVASHDQDDGYITHVPDGSDDFARNQRFLLRGKLAWQPEAWSAFQSLLMLGVNRDDGQPDYNQERGEAGTDRAQRRTSAVSVDTRDLTESRVVSWRNTLEWSERITLTAITAAMDTDQDYLRDFDGLEEEGGSNPITARGRNISQELRLGFQDWYGARGIVGLYAGRFKIDETIGSRGVRIPASFLLPIPVAGELVEVETDFVSNEERDAHNFAVFTETDWELPWQLTGTLGLRYDRETLDSSNSFQTERAVANVVTPGGRVPVPLPGTTLADLLVLGGQAPDTNGSQGGRTTYDALLPKVGLRREIARDWSVFGIYSEAYRAGGVDVDPTTGETLPFDPEYTQNWELGTRAVLPKGRIDVSANLFYTDWEDQQVTVPRGPFFVTQNAGKSRLWGAEGTVGWQAFRSLRVDLSLGFVDTEFLEYVSANQDFAGNDFVLAPRRTASLGAQWRATRRWLASGNLSYRSHAYTSPANDEGERSETRTLLDLRTGYQGDRISIFLIGRNVLDRDYVNETYQFRSGYVGAGSARGYAAYGAPSTVSLQLEGRF